MIHIIIFSSYSHDTSSSPMTSLNIEKAIGAITEASIGVKKAPSKSNFLFISCFTVSVIPLINTPAFLVTLLF